MRTTSTLIAAALVAGVLGAATSATAASVAVTDPADATASRTDVRALTVRHGREKVVVTTTYTDLRRRNAAGASIWFDTDRTRRGPEFVVDTGLARGTDYQVLRTRNWRRVGEPRSCAFRVRLDPAANTSRVVIGRGCLRSPDRVRVSQQMIDHADRSHPVTDWAPGQRRWTPWVSAG